MVEAAVPESVNYHFTRQCNYKCGFCYYTALTSYVLPIDDAKRGLKMLKDAGMHKINFSGGEPFLHKRGKFLGDLVKYCKEEINVQSVSVISNGSLITEKWMQDYGKYVDILGVSCDSFNEEVSVVLIYLFLRAALCKLCLKDKLPSYVTSKKQLLVDQNRPFGFVIKRFRNP